mgnify:FL=1
MSHVWHIVFPFIPIGLMRNTPSSSGGEPVTSETKERSDDEPDQLVVLKSDEANGLAHNRRFVCATCGYDIGSNRNIFFMLDNVYCSQRCRNEKLRNYCNTRTHKATNYKERIACEKKGGNTMKAGNAFAMLAADARLKKAELPATG